MTKTYVTKKEDIKRQWFVVDAKDKILGRLASKVAVILRGKNKPIFTPFMDAGDGVIARPVKRFFRDKIGLETVALDCFAPQRVFGVGKISVFVIEIPLAVNELAARIQTFCQRLKTVSQFATRNFFDENFVDYRRFHELHQFFLVFFRHSVRGRYAFPKLFASNWHHFHFKN